MTVIRPKLVVGLGNPGTAYRHTRHNIGFTVLEALERSGGRGKKVRGVRHSDVRKLTVQGCSFYAVRALTYMNLTGRALAELAAVLDYQPGETLVVTDCLDLPFGKVRIRKKGGSGGHNGLDSVIEALGTTGFPRVRVGIGAHEPVSDTVDYVLGEWSSQEAEHLPAVVDTVVQAVHCAMRNGIDEAMNRFNNRQAGPTTADQQDHDGPNQ